MTRYLRSAGEQLAIRSDVGWIAELVEDGAGGELRATASGTPSVEVHVERGARPFATPGWEPLTRGAWRRDREVVMEDVCATGFDLHARFERGVPRFTYRYRPDVRARGAALALRDRFALLARALLLQYPLLWAAGVRGRAPVHAAACTGGGVVVLLAGPAGVGKSTLVDMELAAGETATGDNVSVSDGATVWGLVEPLRREGGDGRRTTHGRRERALVGRAEALTPTAVAVLRRGVGVGALVAGCSPEQATAALVTGTYMAGELRRFWGYAAALAAGTACGPPHPPVGDVAGALARRGRAFEITLPARPGPRLSELLGAVEECV